MRITVKVFVIAIVILGLVGCGGSRLQNELSQFKAAQEELEANKALVLRAHDEVWNSGKFAVVDELYSEDYISHWAYGEDSDREGLKAMVAEARGAFPDMKEDVVHIVAEGDFVVTHFVSSGTLSGAMKGLQPAGQKVSRPEIAVHRVMNGKIVEQWTVADQMTLLRQLGLN